MGRKKRAEGYILASLGIIPLMTACTEIGKETDSTYGSVIITLSDPIYDTRAVIPDEDAINDLNLIIFEDRSTEDIIWKYSVQTDQSIHKCSASL